MPREVNVFIENFTPKGSSDNYNADIRIDYVTNSGVRKSKSRNVPWPQCLNWLSDEVRMALVQDVLVLCMRKYEKVDEE